jgi:hypothetical protein
MIRSPKSLAAASAVLMLSACASGPIGPTVAVYPSPNKPPQVFYEDQVFCQNFAQAQIEGRANAADRNAVASAVIGTLLGAGLGAAVGRGDGAAIGAASGAVVGTAIGTSNANVSQRGLQRDYNTAYLQCMYSKGDQIPGAQQIAFLPPPRESTPPPPPPEPAIVSTPLPPAPMGDPTQNRELVQKVQIELRRLGLLDSADGAYGPKTKTAISNYERIKGLPINGLPSETLLNSLKAN